MGSKHYDFLNDSILFNQDAIESEYKNESESRLEKELQDYRQYVTKNIQEIGDDIKKTNSALRVFSTDGFTPFKLLKQTALYINQFVVSDPLFHHTHEQSSTATVLSKYIGMEEKGMDKGGIASAARYLKELSPMVAADFVKIFPTEYYKEPPKELPLKYSENSFEDILPPKILRIYKNKAIVSNMEKSPGGYIILDKQPLVPGRAISIEFENIGSRRGKMYFLFKSQVVAYNEEAGTYTERKWLPDTPPSEEEFNHWVNQSINQAAIAHYDELSKDAYLSSALNSSFIIDRNFEAEILGQEIEATKSITEFTATQMLNLELPFMANIDTQKLMDIRNSEADVFTNFRLELEKNFRDLRSITDEKQLKQKIENVFHELNEVQVHKINMKFNHLKKQVALNTFFGVGGLAGAFPSGGWSLIASVIAAGRGYKDFREYKEKMTDNPAYFLWKVKSK